MITGITHRNADRERAIRQSHLGQEMREPIARSIEQTVYQLDKLMDEVEALHNERLDSAVPVSDVKEFDPATYYPTNTIVKMSTVESKRYYRLTEPHPVNRSWGATKKVRIPYMDGRDDHAQLVITRYNRQ